MLKIASVLTPPSPENLQLAAQCGVEGVVLRYPGTELSILQEMVSNLESYHLSAAAVEGYLPIESIKIGGEQALRELEEMKLLVRNMGSVGIPILCYNFMPGMDWVRTSVSQIERGGALVSGFHLPDAVSAVSLNSRSNLEAQVCITKDELWANLKNFLLELVPVAQEAGVTLAMHPDDPPLSAFNGSDRIMNSIEAFERLIDLVPSDHNKICFCQGTFATLGVDIPDTIRRLGSRIAYVHFRDSRGTPESFVETFHDNGPTDMAKAIEALMEIGFNGHIRPDHVPQLIGEEEGEPGYTMLGRLFAFGYIRGLIHGVQNRFPK